MAHHIPEPSFKTHPGRGQHFLIDDYYIQRILDLAEVGPEDEVIEIGPGFGALTIPLSKRVSRIIAIESDRRLVKLLNDRFARDVDRIKIIQADVMHMDFVLLCKDLNRPPVVLGNLPYYLATALVQRLLPLGKHLKRMVFMLQKEVAERIIAGSSTKSYGYLSLIVQYFAEADCLLDIPPTVFKPRPKVQSTVIRLNFRSEPPVRVVDERTLFRIISSGFMHRRKTLINALKLDPTLVDLNIERVCQSVGLERNARAEALTLEDFALLSNALACENG
ncbi:MAG: 16S rRNA (adenine(1518)-N(6)/adenine(1519)-N(6))-dimethyltransferase RsmA [bacterium]